MSSPFTRDLSPQDREDLRYMKRKGFKWGMIALVLVVALSIGGIVWNQFIRRTVAPFEGQTQAIERTQGDGDFRIAAYNWFYDQCAAIEAAEARITIQEQELDGADESRAARINTNLTAQRNVRASLITEYNQEARKVNTSGQFRAANLPDSLDINAPVFCGRN